LFRDVIIGNSSTPGKFNGLQQIINTGYGSGFLNSMVIEWANNGIDGQGGGTKTLNGEPIPATANLINVLLEIFRRYRQRIRWSPQLANQTLNTDDIVLVLPTHLATCILDAFTCWSVCAGGEFNPVNLQTYEARQFRNSLNGGRWGAGRITLDGVTINLFPYDWETMHGTNSGDMYFLTLRVGTQNIWEGEHLDAAAAAAQMQGEGHGEYFSTDGGRIIGVTEADNLCRVTKIWIRPRLICRAPWLQTRIMNVSCASILPPLGPDPLQTSFYPETSFVGQMATIS
jgi:hypothetical protein